MPRKRAADLMLNSSGGVPASIAASDRGRRRSVLFVNDRAPGVEHSYFGNLLLSTDSLQEPVLSKVLGSPTYLT